jgi:hypothetical protein
VNAPDRSDAEEMSLVERAGRLAGRCGGFLRDQRLALKDRPWTVYYAVDADIVSLFLEPANKANYADVFAGPDELLARLMADFLMLEFGGASRGDTLGPLLVIPPHDDQISRMLMRISEKHLDRYQAADSGFGEFVSQFPEVMNVSDDQKFAAWLVEQAPELIEMFDEASGPAAALKRFNLIPESRLVGLEAYATPEGDWAFPLPEYEADEEALAQFAKMVEMWTPTLQAHRSPKQRRYNVEEDAIVLATVQWINQQLDAERVRLLLITGTKGILEAAAEEKHKIATGSEAGHLFSDAYIRHPQAFLCDRGFFVSGEEEPPRPPFLLDEWLNLVFPNVLRFDDDGVAIVDTKQLSSSIEGMATTASATPSETDAKGTVKSEWQRQVEAAAVARRLGQDEQQWPGRATRLLEWIRNRAGDGWTLDQLREDIGLRATRSLSAMYTSTSWLSLWGRLRRLPDMARGIPALRFEWPYELAQHYYEFVVDAMRREAQGNDEEPAATSAALSRLYDELALIDPTGYLRQVIHALAYATKGHWYATRTLCRIALHVVEKLGDPGTNLRGREAAYLLAVTERRMARTADDLESSRRHLADARTHREDPGRTPDPRFESEAISQDVAAINFGWFVSKWSPLETRWREIAKRSFGLLDTLSSEPVVEIRRWVVQQVVTNLLDVALALRDAEGAQAPAWSEPVQRVLALVRDDEGVRLTILRDDIAAFLYTTAQAVFAPDATERRAAAERLPTLRFPTTRPFDRAREEAFRRLAAGTP